MNTMNKRLILECLSNHFEEFKEKYKVEYIGLFGSYARDEATEESDIDIFVKMPPKMFDRIAIKNLIQDGLGKEVDIIREHKHIDSLLLKHIEDDVIYVSDELIQNDVVNKLKELKPIYQQEGIEIVALFGSYARNTQSKYSDIDIAYKINHKECSKQYPNAFAKLIRIEEIQKELKKIFKKDIDFVPDANKKILEDMIPI